ncbi:TetR/AcrR family transcriptional regulator C-terminal domain-containing protein [Kitasatospora mediocidica]|uniref:TetR/AcrR family transcriptional regulator C-terminal domain-containing protein n=1 Tax=Kitasatospora mediocidica TaxID=58352 RepID=UPI00068DE72F|nr:TetR/AcrR family transcriptional regulator C-terminal domain-containing protein [Kitasatospora mediocidica]
MGVVDVSVGSAAWWKQRYADRAGRRPRPGGLTMAAISAAALEIADREGLEALTMRRLAAVMGIRPTSLYRHVAGREELLVEVVDRVLGLVRLPDPELGWRSAIVLGAGEFRRVLLDHRSVVPLLTSSQLLGPHALRAREQSLRLLTDAGWSSQSAVQVYLTVTHFVIGSALLDTSKAARTAASRTAMATLFSELSPAGHPMLRAHAALLGGHDSDAEFRFGLRCLLDGIVRTPGAPGG